MAVNGLAAIVTILLILTLRPVAISVGLVDKPGGRKTHHGEVPVIGGIAMFVGAAFGLAFFHATQPWLLSYLMAGALLVLTGVIDDRFDLSPYVRLLAQTVAGLVMVYGAGLQIRSLGYIFGGASFELPAFAVPFTLLGTAAAINAYNMMDGMDGLAGGLAAAGLGTLAVAAALGGGAAAALPLTVLIAAIGGFLLFNLPIQANRSLRSFMGDAGSTFLGFSIAWFGVLFSQGEGALLQPILILWASSVPLMELFSSSIRRLAAGRSPLSADADHFHHVLVRSGFSVRATFLILIGLQVTFSVTGIALMHAGVADHVSFLLFIAATVTASVLLLRAEQLVRGAIPLVLRRERRTRRRAEQLAQSKQRASASVGAAASLADSTGGRASAGQAIASVASFQRTEPSSCAE